LNLQKPLVFETAEVLPALNHFVIVDDFQICWRWNNPQLSSRNRIIIIPETGFLNLRRKKKSPSEFRAQRQKQSPALILISGPFGTGRIALAKKLEKRLFQEGKHVYFLSIGSVLEKSSDNPLLPQADHPKKTLL